MANNEIFAGLNDANETDRNSIFWHLIALGILRTETETGIAIDDGFDAPFWPPQGDTVPDPTRVAIIDTGIDYEHPNLVGAVDDFDEIDFAVRLNGARYRGNPSKIQSTNVLRDELLSALPEGSEVQSRFESIYDTLIADTVEVLPTEDPSRYFGAHGTACAGLVGGRPNPGQKEGVLQYYGANPFCKVIPIATPYSHEIRPMIHALIYAFVKGAHVIYIPRGLPNYEERSKITALSPRKTRIDNDPMALPAPLDDSFIPQDADLAVKQRLEQDAEVFEALLKIISKLRYVVMAAGNDGWPDAVSYPASVSGFDVNEMPIVVTARNEAGHLSSYANGTALLDDLLVMPSDDGFAFDEDRVALNQRAREPFDFNYLPHIGDQPTSTFSYWGVLSLDVRGSYGYATGLRSDPPDHDDDESSDGLYTIFGGTSAASAIAAGAISLFVRNGILPPLPPPLTELKSTLLAAGVTL